jgi:hypothetical protein
MPSSGRIAATFDQHWKEHPETGCWEWQRAKTSQGYGELTVRVAGEKRVVLAHRFSYERTYGSIKDDLFALHRCDNRACVNPDHLFLGTSTDNMQDMARKGRARGGPPSGLRNPAAKLGEVDKERIRDIRRAGEHSLRAIGKYFGVSDTAIMKVLRSVPCPP